MKSLAEICRKDREMMKKTWRPGVKRPIRPVEMKLERIADSSRVGGYFDAVSRNIGTAKITQAKRGL